MSMSLGFGIYIGAQNNSGGFVGALDTLSAAAAYSTRRLRTAYTGPCMRVRRSTDNAEQDIGLTAAGDLDTVALLAFVGAGDGFVTTWHDQSGNARDAVQATAASQPRIVNAGVVETEGGRPSPQFGFSGFSGLVASFGIASASNWTLLAIAKSVRATFGGPLALPVISDSATSRVGLQAFSASSIGPIVSASAGSVLGTAPGTTALCITTGVIAGPSSAIFRDGTSFGSGNVASAAIPTTHVIGCRFSLDINGFVGGIAEYIAFPSAISTPARQTLERNQGAYYGITVA